MKSACGIALWVIVLVGSANAASKVESEGIARFTPPDGWTRATVNSQTSFVAPDGLGVFAVAPSQLCGSIEKSAQELIAKISALPDFHQETQVTGGKHIATGGDWRQVAYTYADPARPGQFNYVWATIVAAGGRSVNIVAVFQNAAAYNRHVAALGRMVDKLQITSAMVVERGNPPLTRFMIEGTDDFVEWLMQVQLTDGQKETVETELRRMWQKNSKEDIDGLMKILDSRDKLAAMKPEERELVRQKILDDGIAEWRKDPSVGAKLLVDIYDGTHKPIAAGNPPLTRQAVDAFSEVLFFAAGQVSGVTCPPPAELKAKLADAIAKDYPSMGPDQQKQISQMPLGWAALRVAWPAYSDAEKQQKIEAWKSQDSIVKLAGLLKQAAPAGSASSSGNSNAGVITAMQKAQNQAFAFQVMSNCMRMRHETNMMIINNMNDHYRYEYRWR